MGHQNSDSLSKTNLTCIKSRGISNRVMCPLLEIGEFFKIEKKKGGKKKSCLDMTNSHGVTDMRTLDLGEFFC